MGWVGQQAFKYYGNRSHHNNYDTPTPFNHIPDHTVFCHHHHSFSSYLVLTWKICIVYSNLLRVIV
jgi:hypothetical protein